MKKTLFLFVSILLFSCSDDFENLYLTDLGDMPQLKANIRSIENVKGIAKDYIMQSRFQGRRMAEYTNDEENFEIEVLTLQLLEEIKKSDTEYLNAQAPAKAPTSTLKPGKDTVMFAVKTSTSTLLIPAFENAAPVFAEMDDPNFSWNILGKNVEGMDNPLEHLLVPVLDQEYWKIFGQDSCTVWGRYEPIYWEKEEFVEPKLKVSWGQGAPFNNYCPAGCLAGCVAIASAQALTITRNWNSFEGKPLNYDNLIKVEDYRYENIYPYETDTIAQLIRYIGKVVGMKYGKDLSGAKTSKAVDRIFKPYMNVSTNVKDIRRALYNPRGIVIVSSKRKESAKKIGHAYNIDGFKKFKYGYSMMHVNFGWGPYSSGYFMENIFNPTFKDDAIEKYPYKMKIYSIY